MRTSAGTYAVITLCALLASILAFGLTAPSVFMAFLAGYFFGTSSPESKMNAEYAKLMVRSKEVATGIFTAKKTIQEQELEPWQRDYKMHEKNLVGEDDE